MSYTCYWPVIRVSLYFGNLYKLTSEFMYEDNYIPFASMRQHPFSPFMTREPTLSFSHIQEAIRRLLVTSPSLPFAPDHAMLFFTLVERHLRKNAAWTKIKLSVNYRCLLKDFDVCSERFDFETSLSDSRENQ